MSIIAAVRKDNMTVMAADSLTTFGDDRHMPAANTSTRKIRRVGDSLLGSAGWAVYDCILTDFLEGRQAPELSSDRAIFTFFLDLWKALHDNYPFVNDQAQSKDSPFGDLDSSFLIANSGGIFKISHDLDVCSFNQYYAIGSGSEYALGALLNLYDTTSDAGEIARRSVETAGQFDAHCGGETQLVTVG